MNIEAAVVERLNIRRVTAEQLYSVISSYLKQQRTSDPTVILNDSQLGKFTEAWLTKAYGKFDPFLCDSLTSRTVALLKAVRDIAFALNPAAPDLSIWNNPACLLAGAIAPFQVDDDELQNPLFNMKEFYIKFNSIQETLTKLVKTPAANDELKPVISAAGTE